MIGRLFAYAGLALLAAFCAFGLYVIFAILPVMMWAENKCLAKGYPKVNVTVTLDVYCTNLDGAVTTKVEKL